MCGASGREPVPWRVSRVLRRTAQLFEGKDKLKKYAKPRLRSMQTCTPTLALSRQRSCPLSEMQSEVFGKWSGRRISAAGCALSVAHGAASAQMFPGGRRLCEGSLWLGSVPGAPAPAVPKPGHDRAPAQGGCSRPSKTANHAARQGLHCKRGLARTYNLALKSPENCAGCSGTALTAMSLWASLRLHGPSGKSAPNHGERCPSRPKELAC